jgi:hypothetical protein
LPEGHFKPKAFGSAHEIASKERNAFLNHRSEAPVKMDAVDSTSSGTLARTRSRADVVDSAIQGYLDLFYTKKERCP